MTIHAAYDEDFYTWTQEQARLLRGFPTASLVPNALDLVHIAEEIEAMGRSELNAVLACLQQMFIHLIKLKALGLEAPQARGWIAETLAFHSNVRRGFSPGMRQLIDLEGVWEDATSDAIQALTIYGDAVPSLPQRCPFTLDALLAQRIDIATMLNALSQPGLDFDR